MDNDQLLDAFRLRIQKMKAFIEQVNAELASQRSAQDQQRTRIAIVAGVVTGAAIGIPLGRCLLGRFYGRS